MSNTPTDTELHGFTLCAPVTPEELDFSGQADLEEFYACIAADNLRWGGYGPVVFCAIEWADSPLGAPYRTTHRLLIVRVWARRGVVA